MTDRTCIAPDCDRAIAVKSKRMCFKHYQRFMKTGSTELARPVKVCKVEGCGQELIGSIGKGMCSKHYQRWRKYGTTDLPAGEVQWWHEGRGKHQPQCTEGGCDRPHKANGLCSMHDSRRVRGDRNPEMCQWCWGVFTPLRTAQRFCSDKCAMDKRLDSGRAYQVVFRREHPAEPAETFAAKCMFCHADFDATRRRYRYCSKTCWVGARNAGTDTGALRRKERLSKARVERFSKWDIFDRDGWVCGLCHEPIDKEEKFPSPWSVSLDHIIPIARDGDHVPENCQAAHLRCNSKKNSRLITPG